MLLSQKRKSLEYIKILKFYVFIFYSIIGKLPKNLDAEIDPERWLPRRERSYYRGKKKDKRRDIGKQFKLIFITISFCVSSLECFTQSYSW